MKALSLIQTSKVYTIFGFLLSGNRVVMILETLYTKRYIKSLIETVFLRWYYAENLNLR